MISGRPRRTGTLFCVLAKKSSGDTLPALLPETVKT